MLSLERTFDPRHRNVSRDIYRTFCTYQHPIHLRVPYSPFPSLTYHLQVEDTLNNSNDLFLTFRKEMEEMSKKTKRLEKENLNLTRKHDLTNRNILEMAEERTKVNKEMETLQKKNNTLEQLARRMQDQGRTVAGAGAVEGDDEGTESDYEEEDYDEDEGSEEGEYDDDTEEEALQAQVGALPTFGPVPPPLPSSQQAQVNGKVNGVKSIAV